MKLTEEQKTVMCAVGDGADVWGNFEARICRELEKLKMVRVVKAKNAPKNGAARQPYFGAKLTAAGRQALGRVHESTSDMTREEWNTAYAARIVEITGMSMEVALVCAEADDTLYTEGVEPAEAADEEVSYWEGDEV